MEEQNDLRPESSRAWAVGALWSWDRQAPIQITVILEHLTSFPTARSSGWYSLQTSPKGPQAQGLRQSPRGSRQHTPINPLP